MRQSIVVSSLLLSAAVGLCSTPVFAESAHQPHAAHVHGVARLDVAIDGPELLIELDTPMANITGFEHVAQTAEQSADVQAALTLLRDGDKLFIADPAAGCKTETVTIDAPGLDSRNLDADKPMHREHAHDGEDAHLTHGRDEHDSKPDHHPDEHPVAHADIVASYILHCQSPRDIGWLDVRLFEQFDAIERIDVQWISTDGQGAATLTHDSPRISF